MLDRLINLPNSHSFFLFGARGTGKTLLLKRLFPSNKALYIDLLSAIDYEELSLRPQALSERVSRLDGDIQWVIIDEIQKLPQLLDIIHLEIEAHSRTRMGISNERNRDEIFFALTGSSARKLKRGGANLLAGRAILRNIFPLTHREFEKQFDLKTVLEWGSLPKVILSKSDEERRDLLRTYVFTYLKEEIAEEQIVRQLDPFHRFLDIAAQSNGKIVNFAKTGRDVGVNTQTVQEYYQILEDTLIAIRLDSFHESVRKRQRQNPKYYFFDTGVVRALSRVLNVILEPQTYAFGKAFEHFVILEIYRLSKYQQNDWEFSYLTTKDGAEIDLIIDRPGLPRVLLELKSTERVTEEDVITVARFKKDMINTEAYCFSRDPNAKVISGVHALPWKEGLREIGL